MGARSLSEFGRHRGENRGVGATHCRASKRHAGPAGFAAVAAHL